MALETPNRVHASAVCFWEVLSLGPPELYAVGFESRHNFSAITLDPDEPGDDPDEIQLTMVRAVAKNEAIAFLAADVSTRMDTAGVSVGPPAAPFDPFLPDNFIDNSTVFDVNIYELFPPPRLTQQGGAEIGDRANFYVTVLAVPPSPEELAPLGTL